MNGIATGKTMTVKEVADALGAAESTVRNKVSELFPGLAENGKATYLSEEQAAEIKQNIAPRTLTLKSKLENAVTEVEMSEMTFKVLQYHLQKSTRLEAENQTLKIEKQMMLPKVESAEALIRCDKNMSVTDAAKHFGLHPRTQVYAFLREKGFLTARSLPTQDAIDANILAVRQNQYNGTDFKPRVVVETAQLEKWRTWLVPRIVEWVNEDIGA